MLTLYIMTVYLRTYGSVKPSIRALTISVCATESDLDYSVIHPSRDTYGICGIKLALWSEIIPEITRYNVNSLYAGSLVLDYLLKKNHYNLLAAIKEYKGTQYNYKPVHKVFKIYKEIKSK